MKKNKEEIVILFAGDGGDGIQFLGKNFADAVAHYGNDISTITDIPGEIRPPKGTIDGISGFKIKFSNIDIFSPGDKADVIVVMNASSLKKNINQLKERGTIIANINGFDDKNLKLSGQNDNPLEKLKNFYNVINIDLKKLIDEASVGFQEITVREKDKSKNIFILGLLYWIYDKDIDKAIEGIRRKFPKKSNYNEVLLKNGYNYGETSELIERKIINAQENIEKGIYRTILGNEAISLALITASKKIQKKLFYTSYPITPASDILHFLSNYESIDLDIFQAEDEIGAICSAIGASFSGALAATATSGPGMSLKTEGIGLAIMLEIPLVIINVQRGGPSTGLPTKVEQSDLNISFFGRHGEAPIPVFACKSPKDSFDITLKASKISVEHMTPVIILSDAYLVNSSEAWRVPNFEETDNIKIPLENNNYIKEDKYLAYMRDAKFVRTWRIPSEKGFENRIGGLERDFYTGDISQDGINHQKMVNVRQNKIMKIEDYIPLQEIELGKLKGNILVLSWGSTYGTIKTAVQELLDEGKEISFTHLEYLNPFPKNLGYILNSFNKIIIPELNNGQLKNIINSKYNINAIGINKTEGSQFMVEEIKNEIDKLIDNNI